MLSSNIKAIDIVLAISNMTAHSLNVAITHPTTLDCENHRHKLCPPSVNDTHD